MNAPELAGFRAAARSLQLVNWNSVPVSAPLSLASKSRFPETETVDRGDLVRMTELTDADRTALLFRACGQEARFSRCLTGVSI